MKDAKLAESDEITEVKLRDFKLCKYLSLKGQTFYGNLFKCTCAKLKNKK